MEIKYVFILSYVLIMCLLGFTLMGVDKRRAKTGAWRVPEKNLFIVAVLGGSMGILSGMKFFRHKTKHKRFYLGVPLILALQLGIIVIEGCRV